MEIRNEREDEKPTKHRDNLAIGAKVSRTHREKIRATQQSYKPFVPGSAPPPAAKAVIDRIKHRMAGEQ